MVAAEGRDYAALILIVISQSAVNRVRVLFQQHQSDCLHEMNRMGAIWNPGPLLAAGKKKKNKVPIFAGSRQTVARPAGGIRVICGIHLSFTTFGWL